MVSLSLGKSVAGGRGWVLGWIVAAGLLAVAGCREGRPGDGTLTHALAPQNRDVDILFLVDDSPSMTPLQQSLIAGFPTLMDTLTALPGGLPNIHSPSFRRTWARATA